MTRQMEQAYERRNLEGFEGDYIMKERVRKLIDDYAIDTVIECGTYLGGTARQFAFMAKLVITIEININYYKRALSLLKDYKNVITYFSDTVSLLPQLLEVYKDKKILFFIDSHWEDNNPLLAELEIIAQTGMKPVICIHDFKVPGRPELGFDTYKNIIYEWPWIKASVEKIYGVNNYNAEYNSDAEGAKRGCIYLMPK